MRRLPKTFAGALLSASMLAGIACTAQAEVFGLVVGIDDYRNDEMPDLGGAVNDANDIYKALQSINVKHITRLLDAQATRRSILEAWGDIIARAQPNDTVVFSYAGHGAQTRERIAGSEDDGRDEMFQLHGYSRGAGNGDRIMDDELNALFRDAGHLRIIFVADSCHSGTMTRGFDPRAGGGATRGGGFDIIDDDELPPADPQDAEIEESDLQHVLFFGAVKDSQLVVELSIGGQSRGALSWTFANALRGQADVDGDRVLQARELEVYVRETVRVKSEGRQLPQTARRSRDGEVALVLPGGTAPEPVVDAVPDVESVRLKVLGSDAQQQLASGLRNVELVTDGGSDLVWDAGENEIISSTGDVVARFDHAASKSDIQAIVDKWLALKAVRELAAAQPLELRFRDYDSAPGEDDDVTGQLHPEGSRFTFSLSGHEYRHITVFNLALDGKVQYLIPEPNHHEVAYHGIATPGTTYEFPLQVYGPGPFGAEHLVVLASEKPLEGLQASIRELDQMPRARDLRDALHRHLEGQTFQAGSVTLFSAPAQ